MKRAALLIGVSRTGDLPALQAVPQGLAAMQRWAAGQGIAGDRLVTLSDADGKKVRAHQIVDAIEALVAPRDVEQLVVYFAGHGIHNGGDYWLLSDAPGKAGEAVNVESSIQLARYCGLEHVVLVADACRTAAPDIQAQGVSGTPIFPNDPLDGDERAVDAFFACARGKPALEVRDVQQSAAAFSALYTEVLADCLEGRQADAWAAGRHDNADVALLRAWKLSDALEAYVPPRLKAKLGRLPTINQLPTARITSRDQWISMLPPSAIGLGLGLEWELPKAPAAIATPPMAAPGPVRGPSRGGSGGAPAAAAAAEPPPTSVAQAGQVLIDAVVTGNARALGDWSRNPLAQGSAQEAQWLHRMAGEFGQTFGPLHYESGCGFKLRGAQVAQAITRGGNVELLGNDGDVVRVWLQDNKPCSVLLILRNGDSVLLPALPDFIGALTFDNGELAQVAFEPSDYSQRFRDMGNHVEKLKALRAAVAAAANMGVFKLAGPQAAGLARALQVAKGYDPTMALYAAYAYHDLRDHAHLDEMQRYLRADLRVQLFDVALLAGGDLLAQAQKAHRAEAPALLPAVPMLSQGWPLLPAFKVRLPAALAGIERCLRPSLWTLFDGNGTERLARAFQRGDIS